MSERNGSNPGQTVFSRSQWLAVARSLRLSGREFQIVQGVFSDQTDEAIAQELGISPHTVHTHVKRLYQKLEITSRVQLVIRVMAEHLALLRHEFPVSLMQATPDQASPE